MNKVIYDSGFFSLSNLLFDFNSKGLGLKPNEISLYCYLARCGNNAENAFPSYDTIQNVLGISRQTVTNTLNNLLEKGLIVKTRRYSKSSLYNVIKPEDVYIIIDGKLKRKTAEEDKVKEAKKNIVSKEIEKETIEKTIMNKPIITQETAEENKTNDIDIKKFKNECWDLFPAEYNAKSNKTYFTKENVLKLHKKGLNYVEKAIKDYLNDKNLKINGGWKNQKSKQTFLNQLAKEEIKVNSKEQEQKRQEELSKKVVEVKETKFVNEETKNKIDMDF